MAKEKVCGIYCIENLVNGKKYIGQSVDIQMRFYGHKSDLRRNIHSNNHLQKSWNKYGEDNFKFSILEKCESLLLDNKEVFYIKLYNTYTHQNGYNIELGGREKCEVPQSTKDKISRNHSDVSGENNPFFGKKHSEETMQKILSSDGYINRKIKGENNVNCRIKKSDVIEIKKYLFDGHKIKHGEIKQLAEKYKVSEEIISNIKTERTWKYINVSSD